MADTRVGHFAAGAMSGSPTETPSLQASAAAFNAKNPKAFRANGLNQPYMLDPNNGNSPEDAQRQTPTGQLVGPNSMSEKTYALEAPKYGFSLNL